MKLKIVAFGIAKDILKKKELDVDYDVRNIGEFKSVLCEIYPDFLKLNSIAFAVDETYQKDDFALSENKEIVIIPPVAGG